MVGTHKNELPAVESGLAESQEPVEGPVQHSQRAGRAQQLVRGISDPDDRPLVRGPQM